MPHSVSPDEGIDRSRNDSIEIAIIGGGIAGLTLALGLHSRGINVRIYERSRSFREIGAGIGFTANAERAMKTLDPGIHAAFKRVTVQNGTDWFMWMDGESYDDAEAWSGAQEKLIHRMYLGERGFEGCHRADFLEELVRLLPEGTVEFNKKLESIVDDEEGSERVRIAFEDGTLVEADAVIGCDGIRSRVRQLLLGVDHPMSYPGYTHKYAFRGLVPMEAARAELGEERTETRHMYLGPNGHALTFPVAGGKLLNVVAFVTDPKDWPHGEKFTAPASKTDVVDAFAQFNSIVRTIVGLLPDQLDKWAVFDTFDNPAETFVRGRVCIAGDAAHAAAPYHGAGAGFAIEDGAALAHLIATADSATKRERSNDKSELLRAALKAYNSVRIERAQWLVETSRFVGDMYEWQVPKIANDHEKCAKEIEWRSRKIWDYDIDGMLKDADVAFERQVCCN